MSCSICFVIFLVFVSVFASTANAGFGVWEPFPKNKNCIEYSSVEVTCVAYDSNDTSGVIPDRIEFVGSENDEKLTADGNVFFTTKRKDNGRKLFYTLHIRNVTMKYDSQSGPIGNYFCRAYAVNGTKYKEHGFYINVIQESDIPKVETSKVDVLEPGDTATITCNMTERGNRHNVLKQIAWFKNGRMLRSVKNPNPADPEKALGPLVIEEAIAKDGGNYTCVINVVLRAVLEYNVSDITPVSVATTLEYKEAESKAVKTGEGVTLECRARGFPLNLEWKVRKNKDKKAKCFNTSIDGRFKITQEKMYDPYFLTITNLNTNDTGIYYCCLPSNCSAKVTIKEHCQRFTLIVTDPAYSGSTMLWASRGLILSLMTLLFIHL